MSRQTARDVKRKRLQTRSRNLITDKPVNMIQELVFWFAWRITAARYFVGWGLPSHHPNGDPVIINEMLFEVYWPRFIQGLRFGVRGVRRAKREISRSYKSVT